MIKYYHIKISILVQSGDDVLPKESKSNCENCLLLIIHRILQKLMVLFTFTLYIRVILETNQFILLSSVSEIYHFNFSGTKRIVSTSIAFLAFIGWVATIVGMVLLALSKDVGKFSESPEKRSKFAHLFDGISLNKKSQLFAWLLQIRRAIFAILLITVEPKSSIIVISILVGLQLIYFVILVAIKPYGEINCNVIEITNELYFLAFLASLLKYNTAAGWEGTPTTAYFSWIKIFRCVII